MYWSANSTIVVLNTNQRTSNTNRIHSNTSWMDWYVLAHQYKPIHTGRTTDGTPVSVPRIWTRLWPGCSPPLCLSPWKFKIKICLLRALSPSVYVPNDLSCMMGLFGVVNLRHQILTSLPSNRKYSFIFATISWSAGCEQQFLAISSIGYELNTRFNDLRNASSVAEL